MPTGESFFDTKTALISRACGVKTFSPWWDALPRTTLGQRDNKTAISGTMFEVNYRIYNENSRNKDKKEMPILLHLRLKALGRPWLKKGKKNKEVAGKEKEKRKYDPWTFQTWLILVRELSRWIRVIWLNSFFFFRFSKIVMRFVIWFILSFSFFEYTNLVIFYFPGRLHLCSDNHVRW